MNDPQAPLEQPEGTIEIPLPYDMAYKLRHGNPKLYQELMADEIMTKLDQLLQAYVDGPNKLMMKMDDIAWEVGNSDVAIDWYLSVQ